MKNGLVKDWEMDTQFLLQKQKESSIYCNAAELRTSDYEQMFHVCDVLLVAVGSSV